MSSQYATLSVAISEIYFTTLPREVLLPVVVVEELLLFVLRLVVLLLLLLLLLLVVVVVPSKMSHEGITVTATRSNIAAKIHFFMILYCFR